MSWIVEHTYKASPNPQCALIWQRSVRVAFGSELRISTPLLTLEEALESVEREKAIDTALGLPVWIYRLRNAINGVIIIP